MRAPNRLSHRLLLSSKFFVVGLFVPFAFLPSGALAQDARPEVQAQMSPSWRSALDQAVARLPLDEVTRAQAAETTAAKARADRRFAGPLEAEGGLRQDVLGSGFGYYEVEAGVTASLWRRGERALLREQAAGQGSVARLARDVIALEVAGDLRTAWWAYAEARDVAAVEQQQAQLAANVVEQVTRMANGGEMSRLDLRQAEIAAAQASQGAVEAAGRAEQARLALEGITGPMNLMLAQERPSAAASGHPALLLAEAEATQARTQVRLAGANAAPRWRVGVDVRGERGTRGEDLGVSTGIRAAVPLGPDYGARTEAAASATQAARAQVALRRTQIEIDTRVAQARAGLTTAQRRLAQAEAASAAAQEALQLTQRGRREGELSFIEELRAQSAAAQAARALAESKVAVSVAISTLNQSQGLLP